MSTHVGSIYINGVLDKTGSESVSSQYMNNYKLSYYKIGRVTYDSKAYFGGWMSDLIMIDRVIDQTEMKALAGKKHG